MQKSSKRKYVWIAVGLFALVVWFFNSNYRRSALQQEFKHKNTDVSFTYNVVAPEWLKNLCGSDALRSVGFEEITDIRVPTDAKLLELSGIYNLGRVKSVDLCFDKITDQSMAVLLDLPDLEELYLDGSGVTDKSISIIAQIDSLKSLSIANTSITPAGLSQLQEGSSLLEINMDYHPEQGDLWRSIIQLPELEKLAFHNARQIEELTDDDVLLLNRDLSITWLPVDHFTLTDKGMQQLKYLPRTPGLQVVSDSERPITTAGLAALVDVRELTAISLKNADLTDSGLEQLSQVEHLSNLTLIAPLHPEKITAKGFQAISKCPLRWLHLDGFNIDAEMIAALSKSPQLTQLLFWNCTLTEEAFTSLPERPGVTTLYFKNVELQASHFEMMQQLPQLEELILEECTFETSSLCAFLENSYLLKLHLTQHKINELLLEAISQTPRLGSLSFMNCEFEQGILHEPWPLVKFNPLSPGRTTLSFRDSKITDADLAVLGDARLSTLDLHGTAITDAGLELLTVTARKGLNNLDLGATAITDHGIQKLWDIGIMLSLLNLEQTSITDASMPLISKMSSDQMMYLMLANTAITDEGVKNLKLKNTYIMLDLSGTSITNASIPTFNEILRIYQLNVSDTKITPIIFS
ncbi:MAG: hypothetical protein R3C11_15190 [Planctomycetaceae bacterium]